MTRSNWQADCPRCVGSKFTCDEHYQAGRVTVFDTPEIECPKCDNLGFMWPFGPICSECDGKGWRPMSDDELADAAERQEHDRIHGEPPVSVQEQYQRATLAKLEAGQ